MTNQKHLKQRIRARMAKTGERYASARRQILAQSGTASSETTNDPKPHWHLPGNIPAVTTLRALLGHAGIQNPYSGQPFSEAMLFGIAGGIGIGVFSFYYEKEDIATFFIAGRHSWHDDKAYLLNATHRLNATAVVQESGSAKIAAEQLRSTLLDHGPCVVWVDLSGLPHRGSIGQPSGGGYHVITVYHIDSADGTALIGDLTDQPITIPLETLAQVRARIKKDRQRILSIGSVGALPTPRQLVMDGLHACYTGLQHPTLPGAIGNARLTVLQTWAERMHSTKGKERWERVFRPGPNLLRGLCSIHDFTEHYGTGGGLCRPLFADFLSEAAAMLKQPALAILAEQYTILGNGWSNLADAALPNDVGMLRSAKELLIHKAELIHAGGPQHELQKVWEQLRQLEQQAHEAFPLSEQSYAELRSQLYRQILELYQQEVAAQSALAAFLEQAA